MNGRILVVGEAAESGSALIALLRGEGHSVEGAADALQALDRLSNLAPDLVLADLELPEIGGIALLRWIHQQDAEVAVMLMIPAGAAEAGVAALDAGATHYLMKPVNPAELSLVVRRELERGRLRAEAGQLRARLAERYRFENLIGSSAPMQAVFKTVAQVATARAGVLLIGEAGTGKQLVAAAIHEKSPRARRAFVKLDCAALSESILASELFGHERGAFPGAVTRHDGCLSRADRGTLFLAEIGALSPPLQARLLRFLQEQQFERVGGDETINVDARVIASTSRDLPRMTRDGKFRADLLDRLGAITIELPALRDRPSDVAPLAAHFLRQYSTEAAKAISGFTSEALLRLGGYSWPGNVRELEGVVQRAVALGLGPEITGAELPATLHPARPGLAIQIPGSTLEAIERHAITRTLEATGGSTGRAAEILGISIRKVQYKLHQYQIAAGSDAPARGDGAKRN
jgi:two-component system NtrC family response regulator/two-component system response regulator HydG